MAICLVYLTSGITSGKRGFVKSSKWRPFWEFWNIKHSFIFDLRYQKTVPNYEEKIFIVMTSSMTSQDGFKFVLYIHAWDRLAPGESCEGNVSSINVNIVIVFLGYTCRKKISMNNTFRDRKSKVHAVHSTAWWSRSEGLWKGPVYPFSAGW